MDVCMINKKRNVNQTNRSRLNINGAVTMCDSTKLSNPDMTGSFTTVEYSWLKKQGRHLREES